MPTTTTRARTGIRMRMRSGFFPFRRRWGALRRGAARLGAAWERGDVVAGITGPPLQLRVVGYRGRVTVSSQAASWGGRWGAMAWYTWAW